MWLGIKKSDCILRELNSGEWNQWDVKYSAHRKALITFDQSCAANEAKKGNLQMTKSLWSTGHRGKKNKDCIHSVL